MAPQLTVTALLADEVDYSTTPSSAAAAASQGAPVRIVYFMSGKVQHQLVGRPELTGIVDLAGKRIAVNRLGDITAFEVRWALDHFNIPDASLVTLGRDTERIAGVLSGAADAAVLPVPMDIVAERQGLRHLLAIGDVLEVPLAGLVVNEEKLRHEGDEIAAMVRAVVRGTQYLRDPAHREAVAAYIANWADLSPDEGRSALDRVRETYLPAGMPTDAQVQTFLTMLRETGGAPEAITADQIADFSITRRVAAAMGVAP
jgi:ABC-type nitrate/sulfonate/bicarbonate transport system substrate-binding protein